MKSARKNVFSYYRQQKRHPFRQKRCYGMILTEWFMRNIAVIHF